MVFSVYGSLKERSVYFFVTMSILTSNYTCVVQVAKLVSSNVLDLSAHIQLLKGWWNSCN